MLIGIQLWIAKFLELGHFVFELPELNFDLQLYLSNSKGLLLFNLAIWSQFDEWNQRLLFQ